MTRRLDSPWEKGIFVGYDENSTAYLVFHPDIQGVLKNRLVKFITESVTERRTHTDQEMIENDLHGKRAGPLILQESQKSRTETPDKHFNRTRGKQWQHTLSKSPQYLQDSECEVDRGGDQVLTNFHYCHRVMCNVPQTPRKLRAHQHVGLRL